jgi:hypothetical protein
MNQTLTLIILVCKQDFAPWFCIYETSLNKCRWHSTRGPMMTPSPRTRSAVWIARPRLASKARWWSGLTSSADSAMTTQRGYIPHKNPLEHNLRCKFLASDNFQMKILLVSTQTTYQLVDVFEWHHPFAFRGVSTSTGILVLVLLNTHIRRNDIVFKPKISVRCAFFLFDFFSPQHT